MHRSCDNLGHAPWDVGSQSACRTQSDKWLYNQYSRGFSARTERRQQVDLTDLKLKREAEKKEEKEGKNLVFALVWAAKRNRKRQRQKASKTEKKVGF